MGDSLEQGRPQQVVLDAVVMMQQRQEQVDVLGHRGDSPLVPGADSAHSGRAQPELPAEAAVRHLHHPYVGEPGSVESLLRCGVVCHGPSCLLG
jgi:hypothetical protein